MSFKETIAAEVCDCFFCCYIHDFCDYVVFIFLEIKLCFIFSCVCVDFFVILSPN